MGLLRECKLSERQFHVQTILPGSWNPRSRLLSLMMAMMRLQLRTKLLPVPACPPSTRKGCGSSERHPLLRARDRIEGRWRAVDLTRR